MPGGIYVALSGLRHHAEQLDQLASDIANASTSGDFGATTPHP